MSAYPPAGPDYERHRRVVRALAAGPTASAELRQRVERARAARDARPVLGAQGVMAVAAAAVVLLVLATVTVDLLRSAPEPTTERFAALALAPAEGPAPGPSPIEGVLDAEFAGVAFPDWSEQFDWQATGTRTDRVAGRIAHTVFYEHHGHRVSYTVVDGPPLEDPDHAEALALPDFPLHAYRDDTRDVVTFVRNGRTCVLAGDVVDRGTLIDLAAWRAGGALGA